MTPSTVCEKSNFQPRGLYPSKYEGKVMTFSERTQKIYILHTTLLPRKLLEDVISKITV